MSDRGRAGGVLVEPPAVQTEPPPISYLYTHLHDSIRLELDNLGQAVLQLQQTGNSGSAGLGAELAALQNRYHFLEQVYKYHSSVVYPALDSKVRNVTLAYSVEHEDEEHLFEQLNQLLSRALGEPEGKEQLAVVRLLARKVEEIHTTLRKHLRKEEEQLLPLLVAHFSTAEQAELVAQFLCSIPLSTVEQVLGWLKQQVPQAEQARLLVQLQQVVADRLLQQLLLAWLAPPEAADEPMAVDGEERRQAGAAPPAATRQQGTGGGAAAAAPVAADGGWPGGRRFCGGQEEFECCREARGGTRGGGGAGAPCGGSRAAAGGCRIDRDLEEAGQVPGNKPPLREIYYFHQAIRSALHSFAAEARALRAAEGRVTTSQLSALVERHRFIRAVCRFHSASEDEIVFPVLRRVRAAAAAAQPAAAQRQQHDGLQQQQQQQAGGGAGGSTPRLHVEDDHDEEGAKLEELGRLLGAVKAHARRGAKEVAALVCQLSEVADSLAKTMHRHMAREEAEVLPILTRSVCMAQQRHMVWRILRAMPLRLLERVMPWVAGRLREEDVREWLANIRSAAPRHEAPLVELLCQWARRGKLIMPAADGAGGTSASRRRSLDDPSFYPNQTCGPASFLSSMAISQQQQQQQRDGSGDLEAAAGDDSQQQVGAAAAATAAAAPPPQLKRIRTEAGGGAEGGAPLGSGLLPLSPHGVLLPGLSPRFGRGSAGSSPTTDDGSAGATRPIDHIFQFHKALRRELREIEASAVAFQAATEEATAWEFDAAIQELEAKFQFLRGIYRAHSKAEDEIVFPALEAKETLHNVSHAYTLDHKEEEQYFDELAAVLAQIKAARELPELRQHAAQLSRMAEEQELWPLFAEHFSIAEQESLVGVIIGNTGAEVLTTMLSWVQGSMTLDEQEAMIASLKSASKSTAFAQWLGAVRSGPGGGGGGGSPPAAAAAAAAAGGGLAAAAAGGGGEGAAAGGAAAGGGGGASLAPSHQEEMAATLAEVAEYLARQGIAGPAPADPTSLAADSSSFKPGWEDIFRMNQKQLEAAIRRVSNDPHLEPQRKAYLRQNIMASHYIVSQQRRMGSVGSGGSSCAATPTALAAAGVRDGMRLAAPGGAGVVAAAVAAQQAQQAQRGDAAPMPEQQQAQQARPGGSPAASAAAASAAAQPAASRRQPAVPRYHDVGGGVLGCKHYRRRCMLVAPCCDTPHVDRYAVSEMVCLECATRQPVAASCSACGASMARYYCAICHLFDDQPGRSIYHCPFCNFCRQGRGLGVDSFHCMACNACMSLELFNKHRCVEQSLGGNCPVCNDRLFESKHPVKESPCGHFMHSHCFAAYTRYAYTCPVCFKSLGDMSVYWKMIDSLLAAERLPPEYASRRQAILCNDCGQTGEAPFHFVYHKCPACCSFNTRVV
ncbi:hypothetical protein CHLNCDRAFT_138627 [Chlorella variabilis]|uniref:Uncharacterized protein n=1 Tax=Chlorella variabilis TaxID=554065 RepID=E1ZNF1_CHLVA|nr:hypothetical protein CHLNCDRAFT_138627 [Chlorella variabilis]EFN52596.1 hypothetical protein CHLNCDRAFT_138627 [Chlorella variabilis]|eukprot:XP_005844698.1 hypothetical protein CHLNCDRAFT_138627 [Chlorella variabilis]